MLRYERYWKNLIKDRIKFFLLITILIISGLISRLYYFQIYKSEDLKLQALKQRSSEVILSSNRGIIFDRNLKPLTNIKKVKTIVASKKLILSNRDLLEQIIYNTTLNKRQLVEIIEKTDDLVQIPMEQSIDIEGLSNIFEVDIVNRYSDENILSHVIGYINKAENRGEYGIEKTYDEFLNRSDKSYLFVEYDKKRSMILGSDYFVENRITSEEPAGVQLTIDLNIQESVENILDQSREKGAVVVADVQTGEILALSSRPNFNQDKMEDYFNRDDMVLYNRAIQVSYPPGSIFKIVVLLAALEENIDYINKDFFCKGYEQINNVIVKCNNENGHGHISLKDGFAKSCNSVFIQIGQEIGSKKIIEFAKRIGLQEKINIGLLEEVEGLLPEGEELLGPVIGNIAIGQDKIEATPLQITNILLTIVNNGIRKDMTIVKGITTKDGKMIKEYNKLPDKKVFDEKLSKILKEYLQEVVETGTAKEMDINGYGGAAGKTGSAEATKKGEDVIHGWFAGYYPKDNPKYVITVLVEEAKSGSKSAIPIFEEICKEIYKLNY